MTGVYFSYYGNLIIVYELRLYPLVDTVLLLLGLDLGLGFFDKLDNAHLYFLLLVFSDRFSVKPSQNICNGLVDVVFSFHEVKLPEYFLGGH